MNNTNPTTGIAFGYVAADHLDQDMVDILMYGPQATNHSEKEACEAEEARQRAEFGAALDTASKYTYAQYRIEDLRNNFQLDLDNFDPQIEEPRVTGVFGGVTYSSSWLGGALNFFIFDSPVTTDTARTASPCVPGCGILTPERDGSVTCYDVPADWYHNPER